MARVSIQMWTVRQEAEQSLKETLGKLSSIGYKAIETAGLYGLSPSAMRAELADTGLQLSSAHTRLPEQDKADETFAEIAELGARPRSSPCCRLSRSQMMMPSVAPPTP